MLSRFDEEGNAGFKKLPLSMLHIESQAGFGPRASSIMGLTSRESCMQMLQKRLLNSEVT